MDKRDHDFLRRLLSTFEVEAREHIHTISSGLIALERTTAADQQLGIIETIFREAHSLKGAARAVNLAEIEALCQALESIFAALKGQEIALSSGKTLDSQLATLAKSAEQDQRHLAGWWTISWRL